MTSGLGNQNTITSHPCTSYLLSSSIPHGYKQSGNSAQLKTKSLLVTHNGAKKKLCKSQTNQSSARHQHGSAHPRTSCTASVYLFAALSGNSMCISQINLMLKAKPLFYFVTYDPNSLNQGHHPPPSGSLSLQMQFMKVFWPNSDNPRI